MTIKPNLPSVPGIDWAEPGIWDQLRKAYNKNQKLNSHMGDAAFKFRGIRFVPSFAKDLLDHYGTEERQ